MVKTLFIDAAGAHVNYGTSYSDIDEFFMLERAHAATFFMAKTKIQFSYLIDYCLRYNEKCNIKAADSNGNIYSLTIGKLNFRSIDYIFNKPFSRLCKEFNIEHSAKGIEELVNMIEEAGQPFSFINKEYITISKLAALHLQTYLPKNYFNYRYPMVIERWCDWCKTNRIYRGGINCLNENFKGKEIRNLYKYDKNSYFAYVMKYGNMPIGHKYLKQGKPDTNKDVLVHVRLTGRARFKGVYPYKNATGDAMEMMLKYEDWLWIDELEAYKNYYDFSAIDYIEYYEWLWNKPEERFGLFVDEFFELKRTSKGVKRYFVKRILNGAYGKLGQSPVKSNFKIDDKGSLVKTNKMHTNYEDKYNVFVASKITALARAWLLNDIYAATDKRPDLYFVYCDTDSIMMLKPMKTTGDKLGDYKDEGPEEGAPWPYAKFLGCKCYILYDGANYECHAAGVNREALEREINALDWNGACAKFNYGQTFTVPTIVNENGIKSIKLLPKVLKNLEDFEIYEDVWNPVYGAYEQRSN